MRPKPSLIALGAAILLTLAPATAAWGADPAGSSPAPAAPQGPVGEACVPAERPFDPEDIHLTGAWTGGDDITYIRQVGSHIYLNVLSDRMAAPVSLGREYDLVGVGSLADDLTIALDLATVPRGNYLDSGAVTMRVGADAIGNLQIAATRGFIAPTILRPCEPATRVASGFVRPFEYRDEPGVGLMYTGGADWGMPPSVVADYPGHVEDVWGTGRMGISVWRINEDSAMSCEYRQARPETRARAGCLPRLAAHAQRPRGQRGHRGHGRRTAGDQRRRDGQR